MTSVPQGQDAEMAHFHLPTHQPYADAPSIDQTTILQPIRHPERAHISPYHQGRVLSVSTASLNECCTVTRKERRPNSNKKKMALSKSQRIMILLAIDGVFFLIELIVGYAVHSLALVADSFHMLNDVLSLCVGLWAVRVANHGSTKMYTYGWQRAETLGALINGVFLVALCLSIFLEAIQRFVEPQNVSNPRLVLIVGCLGLGSNLLGLFLFHDHGHGGAEEGGHSHDAVKEAEEGHSHTHTQSDPHESVIADERGNIEDVLPQVTVAGYKRGSDANAGRFNKSDEDNTTISGNTNRTPTRQSHSREPHSRHRRRTSGSFGRGFGSVDNIHVHPASFRNEIIQASRLEERSEPESEEEALLDPEESHADETSRVMSSSNGSPRKTPQAKLTGYGSINRKKSMDYQHEEHNHNKPRDVEASGHGHSHGDLNMRGVFLHVMGDALGNIGVIVSALIIWLTTFPGRFYFDPGVSLLITCIILWSAIPLCKAASRILLQAVPVGIDVDNITSDIESLPRVLEAHHLHVWQLSDTKLVASLHVKVDCEVEGGGSASYMHLAREIRRCLHGFGIHSSTIQPEFCVSASKAADDSSSPSGSGPVADGSDANSPKTGHAEDGSKAGSLRSEGKTCMLDCGEDCGPTSQCCSGDAKGATK